MKMFIDAAKRTIEQTQDQLKAVLEREAETIRRYDAKLDAAEAEAADLRARNEALVEANGVLEDALQEVGDDYPGSSCQQWCQQQVKRAREIVAANREG